MIIIVALIGFVRIQSDTPLFTLQPILDTEYKQLIGHRGFLNAQFLNPARKHLISLQFVLTRLALVFADHLDTCGFEFLLLVSVLIRYPYQSSSAYMEAHKREEPGVLYRMTRNGAWKYKRMSLLRLRT